MLSHLREIIVVPTLVTGVVEEALREATALAVAAMIRWACPLEHLACFVCGFIDPGEHREIDEVVAD